MQTWQCAPEVGTNWTRKCTFSSLKVLNSKRTYCSHFNKYSYGKKWIFTWKWMKLDLHLITFTKFTSKWIEDLNARPKSTHFSGRKGWGKLPDRNAGPVIAPSSEAWVEFTCPLTVSSPPPHQDSGFVGSASCETGCLILPCPRVACLPASPLPPSPVTHPLLLSLPFSPWAPPRALPG